MKHLLIVFWLLLCVAITSAACTPVPSFAPPKLAATPTSSGAPMPLVTPQTVTYTPQLPRTSSPATTLTGTRTKTSTTEQNYRVDIALFDQDGRTAVSVPVGQAVSVTIAFRPMKDIVTRWSDGSVTNISQSWVSNTVDGMRFCMGPGRSCTLPDQWVPFSPEQHALVQVNWVGLTDFGVTAQFRDAGGKLVPAGLARLDIAGNWLPITAFVNEQTPVVLQPTGIQTAIAASRAAFPVTGKIQVGEGHPIGGKAGATVNIPVRFEAASPQGQIVEMRVKNDSMGRCLTSQEMSDAQWQPFVASKSYPYTTALNWSTFKLHVQFRDDKGNVSPVYCGDVAVEGSP